MDCNRDQQIQGEEQLLRTAVPETCVALFFCFQELLLALPGVPSLPKPWIPGCAPEGACHHVVHIWSQPDLALIKALFSVLNNVSVRPQ